MAKAETRAVGFSDILISMARAKKESIKKKDSLKDIYDNLLETLKKFNIEAKSAAETLKNVLKN